MNDLISVIIPAYKAEKYIQEAIESVARQTYSEWEVVVVEDASEDKTEFIINNFSNSFSTSKIRYLKHSLNKGLGATRNTGIKNSTGEYIAFLDHDDIWEANHLETLLSLLKDKDADIAYSACNLFNHRIDEIFGYISPNDEELKEFPLSICRRNFIVPSATLVKKVALEDVGLMSEDRKIHGCEDMDCWMKLAQRQYKFVYTSQPTCYYRKHPEAMTAQFSGVNEQKIIVLSKYANSNNIFSEEARLSIAYIYIKLCKACFKSVKTFPKGIFYMIKSFIYFLVYSFIFKKLAIK